MKLQENNSSENPSVLRAMIAQLQQRITEHEISITANNKLIQEKNAIVEKQSQQLTYQQQEIEQLRFKLNQQLQHRFGASSEQTNQRQQNLFDEPHTTEEAKKIAETADEEITVAAHQRKRSGRKPLPKNLPREVIVHDLDDHKKICQCGCELHKIGEDVSEQLDIIPARMKVIRHVRNQYACRACEIGVISAPLPKQPIPKSLATPGLLAHLLVSKYSDHLPLYRQEAMLQRLGIDIARATLCNWVVRVAELFSPLMAALKEEILKSHYIQAEYPSR